MLTSQEMRQQSGPRPAAVCSVAISTVGVYVCACVFVLGVRVCEGYVCMRGACVHVCIPCVRGVCVRALFVSVLFQERQHFLSTLMSGKGIYFDTFLHCIS